MLPKYQSKRQGLFSRLFLYKQSQRGQAGQTRSEAVPGTSPLGKGNPQGPIPQRDQ